MATTLAALIADILDAPEPRRALDLLVPHCHSHRASRGRTFLHRHPARP